MYQRGESVLCACVCVGLNMTNSLDGTKRHYLHNHLSASYLSCTAESMESLNTTRDHHILGHNAAPDGLVNIIFIDILTIKRQYSASSNGAADAARGVFTKSCDKLSSEFCL